MADIWLRRRAVAVSVNRAPAKSACARLRRDTRPQGRHQTAHGGLNFWRIMLMCRMRAWIGKGRHARRVRADDSRSATVQRRRWPEPQLIARSVSVKCNIRVHGDSSREHSEWHCGAAPHRRVGSRRPHASIPHCGARCVAHYDTHRVSSMLLRREHARVRTEPAAKSFGTTATGTFLPHLIPASVASAIYRGMAAARVGVSVGHAPPRAIGPLFCRANFPRPLRLVRRAGAAPVPHDAV